MGTIIIFVSRTLTTKHCVRRFVTKTVCWYAFVLECRCDVAYPLDTYTEITTPTQQQVQDKNTTWRISPNANTKQVYTR